VPEGYAPPRDPVEIQLVAACARALGITPVGIRDDLGSLGIVAPSAALAASQASAALGREIAGDELIAAGDVESAAELIRGRPLAGGLDCIVPMQVVEGSLPLFGIHPAGGHVTSYTHLVRELGVGQSFYGVHSPALEPNVAPHASIDALAAEYAAAVGERFPEHVALLGWSFGGAVAFEMARILLAGGHEVTLIVLDFGPDDRRVVPDDPEYVSLMLLTHAFRLGDRDEIEAVADVGLDRALPDLERRATEKGKLPRGFGLDRLRRMYELNVINLRALKRHDFGRFDSDVTLLRASDREEHMPSETGDPTLGWGPISRNVRVLDTPGTHFDFLGRANLPHVAELLREELGAGARE
jgi:thioesterase domain-containing protein